MAHTVSVSVVRPAQRPVHDCGAGWFRVVNTNRHPLNDPPEHPTYEDGDILMLTAEFIVNITRGTVEPFWEEGGGYLRVVPLGDSKVVIRISSNPVSVSSGGLVRGS